MRIINIFFLSVFFFLAGCTTSVAPTNKTVEDMGVKIEAVRQSTAEAYQKKQEEIVGAKDAEINAIQAQFQQTSNFTYGAFLASQMKTDSERTRLDLILDLRLQTALKYAMPPTLEAVLEQNRTLKEELDLTKVTNEQLQAKYSVSFRDAEVLKQAMNNTLTRVQELEKQKIDIIQDGAKQLDKLQESRSSVETQLLSEKQKEVDNAKNDAAHRQLLIKIFAGVGVLATIGAILTRSVTLGGVAGAFLLLAFFTATAPNWVLWAVPLVAGLGAGVELLFKFHREKSVNEALIPAIQSFKEKATDVYNQHLKPELEKKMVQYKNDVKVADESLIKRIDDKLKSMKLK